MTGIDIDFIGSSTALTECPTHELPEVAFIGRSNVGKSSLLNTLTGKKSLAKTSSTPGKTRRMYFYRVKKPLDMVLVDLPGFGYAKVSKAERNSWIKATASYLRNRKQLAAVVLIVDIRRQAGDAEVEVAHLLRHLGKAVIPVATKADKLAKNKRAAALAGTSNALAGAAVGPALAFSSKTGLGRNDLWHRIRAAVEEQ